MAGIKHNILFLVTIAVVLIDRTHGGYYTDPNKVLSLPNEVNYPPNNYIANSDANKQEVQENALNHNGAHGKQEEGENTKTHYVIEHNGDSVQLNHVKAQQDGSITQPIENQLYKTEHFYLNPVPPIDNNVRNVQPVPLLYGGGQQLLNQNIQLYPYAYQNQLNYNIPAYNIFVPQQQQQVILQSDPLQIGNLHGVVPTSYATSLNIVQDTQVPTPYATNLNIVQDTQVPTSYATSLNVVQGTQVPTLHAASQNVVQDTQVPTSYATSLNVVQGTQVPTLHAASQNVVQDTQVPTSYATSLNVVQGTQVPTLHAASQNVVQDTQVPTSYATSLNVVQGIQVPTLHATSQNVVQDTQVPTSYVTSLNDVQDTQENVVQTLPLNTIQLHNQNQISVENNIQNDLLLISNIPETGQKSNEQSHLISFGTQDSQSENVQQKPIEPIVTKDVYFHVPPPEIEEKPAPILPPKKSYKIIFIKLPSQERKYSPFQNFYSNYAVSQDKTLIYVLVKNQEQQQVIVPQPSPPKPSEHEVIFIKYKTNKASFAGTTHNEEEQKVDDSLILKPGLVNGQWK